MEKEIYFCRLGNGQNKDGKAYYFIEYVNASNFSVKRDYLQSAEEYNNLVRKTEKIEPLKKVIGILGVNYYDKTYIKDIK